MKRKNVVKFEPWSKRPKPPKSEQEKFRDRLFTMVDRLERVGVSRDAIINHLLGIAVERESWRHSARIKSVQLSPFYPSAKPPKGSP